MPNILIHRGVAWALGRITLWFWTCCGESQRNPGKHHLADEGKRSSRQWLDDVKEWTGLNLNKMWRKQEDHVAWRKCVSRDYIA